MQNLLPTTLPPFNPTTPSGFRVSAPAPVAELSTAMLTGSILRHTSGLSKLKQSTSISQTLDILLYAITPSA